jgi:hypothetical protein
MWVYTPHTIKFHSERRYPAACGGVLHSSVILAVLFNEEKQEEALKYWNDADTKNINLYSFDIDMHELALEYGFVTNNL